MLKKLPASPPAGRVSIMHWLADILSGLSLIAVVIIGWKTLEYGHRSTEASEKSADASVQAAQATERSVVASERAARLAEQDAEVRRIESLLDVVLEMRALFNEQNAVTQLLPSRGSLEALARIALIRRLEVRLVPFETKVKQDSNLHSLKSQANWSSTNLEGAIAELKRWITQAISRG